MHIYKPAPLPLTSPGNKKHRIYPGENVSKVFFESTGRFEYQRETQPSTQEQNSSKREPFFFTRGQQPPSLPFPRAYKLPAQRRKDLSYVHPTEMSVLYKCRLTSKHTPPPTLPQPTTQYTTPNSKRSRPIRLLSSSLPPSPVR